MEITAKGKLNFESIRALNHITMFRGKNPKKWLFLSLGIDVFFIMVALGSILWFGSNLYLYMGLLVLLGLLSCFLYFLVPRIQYKALGNMREAENTFLFYDTSVRIFSTGQSYQGEAEALYTLFVRVYETSRYFVLVQANNAAFLVDKTTIVNGTAEDIRARLVTAAGNKYKLCSY